MNSEWLTTEQVAAMFDITPQSVRTNFPRRYGIRPQNDKWRRADVLKAYLQRGTQNRNAA